MKDWRSALTAHGYGDLLTLLDDLAVEPTMPAEVVWFSIQFPSGPRVYDYTVLRCDDNDRWYTTGKLTEGMTWAELIQWACVDNILCSPLRFWHGTFPYHFTLGQRA